MTTWSDYAAQAGAALAEWMAAHPWAPPAEPEPDPPVSTPTRVVRLNCGGPAVTVTGVAWEADRGYSGGTASAQGTGHYGADAVMETERWGDFGYTLTGLPPGPAVVRLHLADSYAADTSPGMRVFDVAVQGSSALRAVDPVALAGGPYRGVVREVPATVGADGRLTVALTTVVNAATLQGLEVLCYGTGTPSQDPGTGGGGTTGSGTWLSGAGVADPYAFGAWRGRPVEVWETWNAQADWATMKRLDTVHAYFTGEKAAPFNRRWTGRLSFSQALWAKGETAATTAGGANDANFRAIAQGLKDVGFGNAFVRLGWEMNGDWFYWHATPANADAWKAGFRRVYEIFKGVSDDFQIVWNPNKSADFPFDVRTVFPGSDHCDVIATDWYNMYPAIHDQKSWDAHYMDVESSGAPYGIGAWIAYAKAQGLPLAFPEWGLNAGPGFGSANGSGDDAIYIQRMHDVFANPANNVVYESYFNLGGAFQVTAPTQFPKAAALYRQLFGK
ncbi:malectin domain-containing carbohydrate-binding protein [Frankia sp. R82]|uniref:malectin domain-containing carbohydrate-binding protein n=1 Tax=Frankia sp. R82 TaxID=2950553 RepID=UPI002043FD25|nr:malectin domain-containing carbohydrate-binding protein [Frankia sp. R82]MCM3884174.1 malectin domain-containing carbohydrate-binding protein [Frankia sp. R82]